MKKMKFLAMFAFAALAFVGCSDDDSVDAPATKLALADPAQAQLTFAAAAEEGEGAPEAQIIVLDTDAKSVNVEQVLEAEEEAADWCVVKVEKTSIRVAPAVNTSDAQRTAKYRIVADQLQPVEFTVTQLAAGEVPPQKDELSIACDAEEFQASVPMIMGTGEYASFTIVVTTTAESWTAKLEPDETNPYAFVLNMMNYGGEDADPETGASGDELEITFNPIFTETPAMAYVEITAGTAEPIRLTLFQGPEAKGKATYVKVTDAEGAEIESPYTVNFAQNESGSANKKTFDIETDGEFDTKIVEEGTSTEVADPETFWLQSYAGLAGWTIYPTSANNTGAERKADVILVGKDDAELFRIKGVQFGTAEMVEPNDGE